MSQILPSECTRGSLGETSGRNSSLESQCLTLEKCLAVLPQTGHGSGTDTGLGKDLRHKGAAELGVCPVGRTVTVLSSALLGCAPCAPLGSAEPSLERFCQGPFCAQLFQALFFLNFPTFLFCLLWTRAFGLDQCCKMMLSSRMSFQPIYGATLTPHQPDPGSDSQFSSQAPN